MDSCVIVFRVNIEFRVPYSQRYLFNAVPDTNHNANPTNPNTIYRCEYGTLNSMFAVFRMTIQSIKPCFIFTVNGV